MSHIISYSQQLFSAGTMMAADSMTPSFPPYSYSQTTFSQGYNPQQQQTSVASPFMHQQQHPMGPAFSQQSSPMMTMTTPSSAYAMTNPNFSHHQQQQQMQSGNPGFNAGMNPMQNGNRMAMAVCLDSHSSFFTAWLFSSVLCD